MKEMMWVRSGEWVANYNEGWMPCMINMDAMLTGME